MARNMTPDDDFDGVQYDDFYAPDPAQIEAEQIRRECAASMRQRAAEELAAEFGNDASEWLV